MGPPTLPCCSPLRNIGGDDGQVTFTHQAWPDSQVILGHLNSSAGNNDSIPRNYNAQLSYVCGSARMFLGEGNTHVESISITCDWSTLWSPSPSIPWSKLWSKLWSPSPVLPQCDWVACLQPPQPPAYANLRPLWHGEPIPFGDSIHFICERGMAFEDDYFQESFKVTCDDGAGQGERRGFFTVPDYNDWPRCVRGESGVRGER